MTLIVTDVPQTINTLLTESIAAVAQIPYSIINKDGDVDSVVDSGGFAELHLNASAGDLTSRLNVGELVFFEPDGIALRLGFYEITSSSFSAGTTRILTTEAFIATDTGIVTLKLRKGYHFDITVVDDTDGVDINSVPLVYIPNQAGRSGLIDMSDIMTNLLKLKLVLSNEFHLEITDDWNGASSQPVVTTDTIQAVFAKKQLLQQGGALMWEQLLTAGSGIFPGGWQNQNDGFNDWTLSGDEWSVLAVSGDPISQTDILRVNTFESIPAGTELDFDVSILLPSSIDYDLEIWARNDPAGTWVEINGGFLAPPGLEFTRNIGVASTVADYDAIGFKLGQRSGSDKTMTITNIVVNSSLPSVVENGKLLTKFENPIKWRGWKRSVSSLIDPDYLSRNGTTTIRLDQREANINKVSGASLGSIYNGSVSTFGVSVKEGILFEASTPFTLVRNTFDGVMESSETIFFEMRNECRNPIMIEWINFDGAFDQHLFSISTIIEIEHDAGLVGERAITSNLENAPFTKFRTVKRCTQRMVLTAEKLKLDQLLAMRDVKNSPLISVWLTKDGVERIFVIATNDFTTPYNSKNDLHDFSLTIELPTNFQFEEGKKY